jgi:hypothetical protein
MSKLTKESYLVLSLLFFEEDFDTLLSESELPAGVLKDELRNMMNSGLVKAIGRTTGSTRREIPVSDLDRLENSSFMATSKGIKAYKLKR